MARQQTSRNAENKPARNATSLASTFATARKSGKAWFFTRKERRGQQLQAQSTGIVTLDVATVVELFVRGLRTNIRMSVRRDTTLEGAITSATQEQKNYNLMMGVPLGASRDIGGNGYGRSSSMGAPRAAPVGSYPTAMPGSGVYAQPAASAASVTPLENTLDEMKDMISTFRNAVDDRFRSLTSDVNTLKKAYNEAPARRTYVPNVGIVCRACQERGHFA